MRFILLLSGLAFLPAPTAAADAKPNILFLFADDMRADSIAAIGHPTAKTPNIDALVNRGFTFRNAYCMGGNSGAVCTPSRNMLLSGNAYFRWKDFTSPNNPKQKGAISPGDGPNFPSVMRQAGYFTYHHGKRGNSAPLIQAKFEANNYLANDDMERKSGEPGREIVDQAIDVLKTKNDPRPWFMYLAFANPHDPRVAAPRYMDLHNPATLPLPKNFLPQHPFDNGNMAIRDEALLPWPRTQVDLRRVLHEYHATVSGLDHHIGRLLDALKAMKQLDNTIVIFSADQGIALGSHGLLGKQNLYDHSMKSPLIFAGPGIVKGTSDALVYLFDIFPTVCELTGTPVPEKIDGRSFKAVLDGKAKTARDALLLAYLNLQRALRDERWKLIRYPQVDVTQLFDLQTDPDEMKDLSADPAQNERAAAMLAKLAALQKQFDDGQSLVVVNPKPKEWTPPKPKP